MSKRGTIRSGTTRGQLAKFYNVDEETIRFWLSEVGVTHSKTLKPIELLKLLKHVGPPDIDVAIRIPFVEIKVLTQKSIWDAA